MGNLDNTSYYSQFSLEDQITTNVIDFLKWGLLEIGGFQTINRGQSNIYGNDASALRIVGLENIPLGKVWGSYRNDWVWESGITTSIPSTPFSVSGIYVNNTFYTNGTNVEGTGWYVDYSRGWIVFDNPIPSSYNIQVPRTERYIHVYNQDNPMFTEITTNYFNGQYWNQPGSGVDNVANFAKSNLPAIFVGIQNYTSDPLELGSRSKWVTATINFDIFATNPSDRKKLSDICYLLESKSFHTYNINSAPRPLTASGTTHSNTKTWPELVNNYGNNTARFKESARLIKNNIQSGPIKHCQVTIGLEIPVYIY